jgi:hypothetical protein
MGQVPLVLVKGTTPGPSAPEKLPLQPFPAALQHMLSQEAGCLPLIACNTGAGVDQKAHIQRYIGTLPVNVWSSFLWSMGALFLSRLAFLAFIWSPHCQVSPPLLLLRRTALLRLLNSMVDILRVLEPSVRYLPQFRGACRIFLLHLGFKLTFVLNNERFHLFAILGQDGT